MSTDERALLRLDPDQLALASPERITAALDVDVWCPGTDGHERLDAGRFLAWLDALLDAGILARTLAALDPDLLVSACAAHVRVFDYAAVAPFLTSDDDEMRVSRVLDADRRLDVGGFVVIPRHSGGWELMAAALMELEASDDGLFRRVMVGCRRLSDAGREEDGLDDLLSADRQQHFEAAASRQERQAARGYVSLAQARAFLSGARRGDAEGTAAASRVALGCFRDLGIVPGTGDELAFLGNVVVAATPVLGRALSADEAVDAVMATCELGRATLTRPGDSGEEVTTLAPVVDVRWAGQPLVEFQAGQAMLHRRGCVAAATRLIEVLGAVRFSDVDLQRDLTSLRAAVRRALAGGEPWEAAGRLDVLDMLDPVMRLALSGLVAPLPVWHQALTACVTTGVRRVDAAAFEWIRSVEQLDRIDRVLDGLADRLFG